MKLDQRKLKILSAIVEQHIKTGEQISSKLISELIDVNVSPATIRNDMACLEKLGLLEQPHTSSGRIPSSLGYEFYINKLVKPKPLSNKEKEMIDNLICQNTITAESIVENAVKILSDLTGYATISSTSFPSFSVISKVEVMETGRKLYALLVITSSGEVKNKVCRMEIDLTYEDIDFFKNFVNENLSGINIENCSKEFIDELAVALGSYMITLSPLLYAFCDLSTEFTQNKVDIKGQNKLLFNSELNFKEVFDFIDSKNQIEQIMKNAFEGIHVILGNQNSHFAVSNSSLLISKYSINDKEIGSFGLVVPMRIDYNKIIPYLEHFSSSITNLLSNLVDEDMKGD